MKTLACDVETYSSTDLSKAGVYKYAESPDFEVLLFGYACDDEPAQVIDLTKEEIPLWLIKALFNSNIVKTAFNAQFERVTLGRFLQVYLPPEQWQCTAVLARELGLPNSLAEVGRVLGLPEDQQKQKTGAALIRYFSKPCTPTKSNGYRTRNLPEHDTEKWRQFIDYNRQDVEVERAIRQKLYKYKIHEREQRLWIIDQKINDRGAMVDTQLAQNAIEINNAIKKELLEQAQELTGVANPNSAQQIKNWIKQKTGVEIKSLNKKVMPDVYQQVGNNECVQKMLDIRAALSKTSVEKYNAIIRCACQDSRIRGLTMFYGASKSGRWAGRLVQVQNLPQNHIPDDQLDDARQLVKAGDIDALKQKYDVISVLSQLIRTAFVPKPSHKFIVADFSAIEARVIAWLAAEKWRLDVFRTHGRIYEASAERMFNLPPGSVQKGDPLRQKGKIAELALGYGGSVGALKAMGALDMGLTEEELQPLVDSWRAANKAIVQYWYDVDTAARKMIKTGEYKKLPYDVFFRKEGPLLKLHLPSGRELSYVKPQINDDLEIVYEGVIQTSRHWGKIETYGAKLVENIVQATARDCLAEVMLKTEQAGIPIVFSVHDEIVCEVPENQAEAALKIVLDIMKETPDWAPGLPLNGDGYICDYYMKK